MDDGKALQMGKSSTAGSFFLLIGIVGSSVILALGTLILNDLLSLDELGLYGLVLIPSSTIAYFRDLGVNTAMTQRIANLRAANKSSEIYDVVFSGVIFQIASGLLCSLVCFAISGQLAILLNRPEISPLIALMCISIFASSLVSAVSAIFVGFEKMKLNSFTQILQALIKTLLGPLLILLGYSVLGAVVGSIVSVVVSGLTGILLVYVVLFRPLRKLKVGKCNIKQTLIPMLKYGLPLTLSSIVIGVLPQIFAFFMGIYAGNDIMANYFNAIYFSILVTFISYPISTVLFPAFSKLDPEKEPELVKTVFSSSVKYTAIFLIPATMLIITLSTPIVNTLFPEGGILSTLFAFSEGSMLPAILTDITRPKFLYAPTFLALSSIVNLFVLFGSVSLSAFQTGIGKTKQMMKQSLLSLTISLPFAYAIITYFGTIGGVKSEEFVVIGGIMAIMVSTIPGMIWGLIWAWKNYGVKADFKNSAKIFTASLIASIAAYIFSTTFTVPYAILLAVGAIIFLLVYLISTPLFGAVNRVDIDNLKTMTSGLGIISKIIAIPLLFMQKICKIKANKHAFRKFLLASTLLCVMLISLLFAYVSVFSSSTVGVHVGNEIELKAAISNASVGVPVVIVLDKDITLKEELVISVDKDITLTSNNNDLKFFKFYFFKLIGADSSSYYKSTIAIESGGVLRLDGIIVTHANNFNGTGIFVNSGGTLILVDGVISGNSHTTGGGVHNGGNFTMLGGKISGNTASGGGGVYNAGIFTMSGGVISNNEAITTGGGVATTTDFTMTGGEISGNTAQKGGGVYSYFYCTINLSGNSIISNNKANLGGGICTDGNLIMHNGEISSNIAESQGGGVYLGDHVVKLSGGKISDNIAANNGGGIWVNEENLDKLFVSNGVTFSNNRAFTAYERNAIHDSVYNSNIATKIVWTAPFTQGYNNYDISYTSGIPLD